MAAPAPIVDDLRTVHLTSGPLRYRDSGGNGAPLVFVHGVFVNGLVWRQVVPPLAARFRCIVPDAPLGAHAVPMFPQANQTPPGVAALLLEFVAALGLTGVTLIGNDTGGALCQLAIAKDPDAVARLVLVNCDSYEHFFPPSLRAFQILPAVPGFTWLFTRLVAPYVARVAFATLVAKRIPERAVLDSFFEPSYTNADVRRDLRRFLTSVSNRQTLAAARTFAQFQKPVLIVWGVDDFFFPVSDGQRLANAFPNARFERIADARTFVQEDQPEALAALIAEFATQA